MNIHKNKIYKLKKTKKINKKYHLIFDLDETLVQSLDLNFKNNKSMIIENPSVSLVSVLDISENGKKTLLYIRPYFYELINFCFTYFNVSFWTAGTENYCQSIINILLTEKQKKDTKVILSRNSKNNREVIDNKNGNIYSIMKYPQQKPLEFLWKHKDFNKFFNNKNTIIIDNSVNVTQYYPYNSILVESYCRLNENDDILSLLKKKLSQIKNLFNGYESIISKNNKIININNHTYRYLRSPIIRKSTYKNIKKYLPNN